ncbi:histidine kinase [Candidatus Magnetomorum sp. HK-1]|nr:histidine kinase [Candidatus Magnetomorum sp. HK-1]
MMNYCNMIMDMIHAIIITMDASGKIFAANSFLKDIPGYAPDELVNGFWYEIFMTKSNKKEQEIFFQNLISKKKTHSYFSEIQLNSSKKICLEWNFSIVRDQQNEIERIIAVGSDVSEYIEHENQLIKKHRKLIERNKELQCMFEMTHIMESSESTFDNKLNKILKIIPSAFQYPQHTSVCISIEGKNYATQGFHEKECCLESDIHINDIICGYISVCYMGRKTEDANEPFDFLEEEKNLIISIARQLSLLLEKHEAQHRRLELEKQLRHADRLAKIGQFSAGFAHELNEPLGNILGYAQLASKNQSLSDSVKKDLESIIKSSLHAREIIKKLMLFSRQMPPRRLKIDLNQLVLDGLYFIESICAKKNIKIVRSLSHNIPPIKADPAQMNQVLVNLVVNAVHAMSFGGKLTISTSVSKNLKSVYLSIKDTGEGMSESVKKQIFMPFFTTKDVNQGTGLGLSVVHGIISSHEAKISVKSTVAKGTRFKISFPAFKDFP